ncbi:MAG: hypothetical protein GF320_14940, partial [Armatimonadia bacterium]|nr:hypothetical protein [Armatimonadia bacterium]
TYAMLTDSNGYFYVRGLPTDSWRVTAWAPGLAADHEAGEITWPEPTNKGLPAEGFSMSIAPNGSISGRVSNDSEPPQGLNGIRVVITAMDAEGNVLVNPLTNEAIVMETTTVTGPGGEDGYYLIEDVPSGVSYQVVANPEPKATTVQINHQTDDTTYSVESENLVPIIPATETEDIDFFLMPQPGRVFGTVFEEGTDPALGIDGALVTVVGTDPAVETESDADGDYDFATADEQFTVPAGSREITASAPGYQPSTVTVQVNANQSIELDIPLKPIPPGTITGKVTQSDGTTGVEGIQVRALFGPSGTQTVAATVTTNADGDFTFAGIEAGVTYTIMATDTELGRNLEPNAGFRVTVESDESHSTSDTDEKLLFKIVPLTTYSSGVHLVSAPYNYPGIDPKTIFGETTADFNMAWWNPALGEYALYPDGVSTIERGKGYFVEFTAPREISRSGEPSDPAVRNQPFDIPLSAAGDGWNLIGNPYDFETDWTKITVLYNGQSLSFADAVAQNLIAGSLFGYDAALKDYFIFTSMRAFQGYWVRALAEGITIQTSNEPVVATGGDASARSETPMAKRGIEWSMQLVAQVGEYRDSDNYLGVAPEDKGLDMRYDLDEPPMARTFAGDDVTVYFPATGADGSARMLAADFRNSLGAGESWEVMVDTTVPSSDVTLSWPDLRSLPRSFSATLEDLATGETVAMRSASHYTFGSGDAQTPRRLKVTLRSQSGADNPTPQVLGVDSLARGVTVSYRLASDVDLRISVLNQAGRIVRTLVQDEHRSAGVHSETWDGRDDGGRALPAGEYRVEFRAVSEDGAVGRATARALR